MTEPSATHATFSLERIYNASPARVFAAWATADAKASWFSGGDEWTLIERAFDFRIGGREHASGAWRNGTISRFDSRYHDIVPNQRIVYAYDMHLGDRHISVSLATVEFKPAGAGTRLILTEQGVFLDGYDDAGARERGTSGLLDRLDAALKQDAAKA
ncbi:MAG: SRPBCC family protein [Stellaceae bacterium]